MKTHDFHKIADVTSHSRFERYLNDIITQRKERESFYNRLHELNPLLDTDTFKPYFEAYSAERKTNQQLYTPDSIANLLSEIIGIGTSAYDPAAGTGTLLIDKWNHDRIQQSPLTYYPHEYLYVAEELADNSLPYLIHNLAYRGMNAIVLHGDSIERIYENVYFIQNSKDDFMAYSDINIMKRSETLEKELDIRGWTGKAIEHTESKEVKWQKKNKGLEKIEGILKGVGV